MGPTSRRRLARALRHPGDVIALARVITLGAVVAPLVKALGVTTAARLLRPGVTAARPRPELLHSRHVAVLAAFADPAFSPWTRGECLERSLLLYRLLNLDGVPVDLVIGLRTHEGVVDGHAWLAIDGHPVLERVDPRDTFRPMLCFPSPLTGSRVPCPVPLAKAS